MLRALLLWAGCELGRRVDLWLAGALALALVPLVGALDPWQDTAPAVGPWLLPAGLLGSAYGLRALRTQSSFLGERLFRGVFAAQLVIVLLPPLLLQALVLWGGAMAGAGFPGGASLGATALLDLQLAGLALLWARLAGNGSWTPWAFPLLSWIAGWAASDGGPAASLFALVVAPSPSFGAAGSLTAGMPALLGVAVPLAVLCAARLVQPVGPRARDPR